MNNKVIDGLRYANDAYSSEYPDIVLSGKAAQNVITQSACSLELKSVALAPLQIKKVIFNPPATIVIWEDDSKTVVKCCEDDIFDPWVGLSMCVCKRLYGDQFHKIFKQHCEEYVKTYKSTDNDILVTTMVYDKPDTSTNDYNIPEFITNLLMREK